MHGSRRSNLTQPQPAIVLPLEFHATFAAVLFDDRFVVGFKNGLPGKPETTPGVQIANILDAFLSELIDDVCRYALQQGAAINNRSFAAFLRSRHTRKENPARPLVGV